MRRLLPALACLLVLLVAGCGGSGSSVSTAKETPRQAETTARSCPSPWRAGWQRLANRVGAPVFCPTWMPSPLDARFGGPYQDINSVDKDRSYLVSFLYHEVGSGDVHVNFRGYPGHTKVPTCTTVETTNGVTKRGRIPCFSDSRGAHRVAGRTVTVYTVNQDADQWHVLYAWQTNGSLYTVSEHVIKPYSFSRVVQNLDRLMRGLVVVRPAVSA